MKSVMTGNQAIARGFWEAGGRLAASYPGSPTVEMLESLKEYDEVYSKFSVNEKVALEMSENFQMPMLLDITSRVCHSRSIVETGKRVEMEIKGFSPDREK